MTLGLPLRIMAAALLLTAALVGLAVHEDYARNSGREVRLPMEAVDPRGLLTGHYVSLRLTQVLAEGQPCPPGLVEATWLALTPTPNGERVTGGSKTRQGALAYGPIVLRGSAQCSGPDRIRFGNLGVDIGVSRFHIDQKRAEAMEKALRDRNAQPAYAVVSVGDDGKARLKGVIIGGQRADLTWF